MIFLGIFLFTLFILFVYRVGVIWGGAHERRKNRKTATELKEIFDGLASKKTRRITLIGGPEGIDGRTIEFGERDLSLHDNKLLVTAIFDGSEMELYYEVQGDVGFHVDQEVTT